MKKSIIEFAFILGVCALSGAAVAEKIGEVDTVFKLIGPDHKIVVDAYDQEQLTEEQDLIFEAILYFNNVSDDFNLRRALTIWSPGDFAQFLTALQSYRG